MPVVGKCFWFVSKEVFETGNYRKPLSCGIKKKINYYPKYKISSGKTIFTGTNST
jgi:hypothetical protein